jgi:hypothetical protein
MLNEKNIEALKNKLFSLGFPGSLEAGLRAQICFQQEAFTLQYRRQKEGYVLNVFLQFQRAAESQDYSCLYYDACLRKPVEVPALLLNGVDTEELKKRMKEVDWHYILPTKFSDEIGNSLPDSIWGRE